MAGLGAKLWTAGEVATAANINGYLMDQTVMKFASTAARDAAFGGVGEPTLSEGMFAYTSDTNTLWFYTGSAWEVATVKPSGNYAAGKNGILNSNFNIFQRGTTSTSTADGYTADRWYTLRSAINVTVSRQASSLQNIPNCARVQRVSGQTGTSPVAFAQFFENAQTVTYANQTITVSFYARKGADYSSASSSLTWRIVTGTGSADSNVFTTGYVSQTIQGFANVILTTDWQRFTGQVTIPSTTTQMSFYFLNNFVGTAGTNDYYEVTGVQLETGSVASAFQTATGTIQGELAACQRYYWRHTSAGLFDPYTAVATASATTLVYATIPVPVQMRIPPSSVDFGGTNFISTFAGGTNYTITAAAIASSGNNVYLPQITLSVASGLTSGQRYDVISNNSTSSFIGLSAEL